MRSLLAQGVVALLIVCGAFPQYALGDTPFSTTVSGNHQQLAALVKTPAKVGAAFQTIRLKADYVHGIGRARFVFNARKLPAAEAVFVHATGSTKDLNVPLLLKGHALLNRGTSRGAGVARQVPAVLSVIKRRVRVQFLSATADAQAKAARLYSVTWKLSQDSSAQAKVATKSHSSFLNKLCDSHAAAKAHSYTTLSTAAASQPAKATFLARVVTLSTDADAEWFAKYGDASNAEIAATVNAAEAIFDTQLGVRFALVRQHVYVGASPYASTDPSVLLASFAKNPENPANLGFSPETFDQDVDVKHLFTGKELNGNVIGLSYVGAICWSPKNAYGLSQNINRDMNITTFLHEVGHTLGASHDTTDVGSIMYPNLGIKRYFSALSVEQMNRALAINGKCVSEEMLGANLANATITLRQKKNKDNRTVTLTGTLTSSRGALLPGEAVKLTFNKKTVVLITDAAGVFKYRINLSKLKVENLKVFAQTINNETSILKPLKVQVRA
jgi:hypothetical protein